MLDQQLGIFFLSEFTGLKGFSVKAFTLLLRIKAIIKQGMLFMFWLLCIILLDQKLHPRYPFFYSAIFAMMAAVPLIRCPA